MASIPGGSYRPLYAMAAMPGMTATSRVRVAPFRMDRLPVTRGEFLRFVLANPSWRRDMIRTELAESAYLAEWPTATNAGSALDLARPVTSVSRLAASAYCAAQGKRLPTVDEWEYVAAADETRRNASDDPAFRSRVLAMNAARTAMAPVVGRQAPNVYGVSDLHGVVWEWTSSSADADAHTNGGSKSHVAERHVGCAGDALGATDPSDYAAFARNAVRAGLGARSTVRSVGFRCAADLPG